MEISLSAARRAAVRAQLLSAPRPRTILSVVERLGRLQLDPTAAVARAEQLVLWSRLGSYDVADLDHALYRDRSLFEYASWILPASQLDLYRQTMRAYLRGTTARQRYVRDWLLANAAFRKHMLAELRRRGPLRSRDFEDRATVPWRTGGWNDDKNVGLMLDVLWYSGELAIVGRQGGERLWDLAAHRYPPGGSRLSPSEVARRRLDALLRAWGIARAAQLGSRWRRPLAELVARRTVLATHIAGLRGDWYLHSSVAESPRFTPRTTLLSPFDQLLADRDRTAALFDFQFKLEIYIPADKRKFGYYVLPILHGERLIGRIDLLYDRKSRTLRVRAVYAEPDAPAAAAAAIARAIRDLGRWLGAGRIEVSRSPSVWRADLVRL